MTILRAYCAWTARRPSVIQHLGHILLDLRAAAGRGIRRRLIWQREPMSDEKVVMLRSQHVFVEKSRICNEPHKARKKQPDAVILQEAALPHTIL